VLNEFGPDLVLVSAGFDAHERDPLASMRVTTGGYASIVRQLVTSAKNGAIAFVTEGGYDLIALAECLDASFAEISRLSLSTDNPAPPAGSRSSTVRAERALEAVRAAQRAYWTAI